MQFAAWALASLALTSCGELKEKFGRQQGHTLVTVNAPASCPSGYCTSAWPSIGGGMMIYAQGVNGTAFATTIPLNLNSASSATAQISLPNGQYMFYAVAWDGSGTTSLNGQAGCGQTTGPQFLTGGAQSVNLVVTTAGCNFGAGNLFSGSGSNFIASGTNFGRPAIHACLGITSGTCTTASSAFYTGSVRVRMEGYTRNGPGTMNFVPSLGITGPCHTLATGNFTTSENVPAGNSAYGQNNFIAATLEFFPNANVCSGAPAKVIHFPNGFASGTTETAFAIGGTGGIYDVYVDLGS